MWAEDQVEQLMMMTNIPARVIEEAKKFPDEVRRRDFARAAGVTNAGRTRDAEVIQRLSAHVREAHERIRDIERALESGDIGALDAVDQISQAQSAINAAQRRHEALTSSEARYREIEADPSAFTESLYDKYPGLQDRRYTLRTFLAERGLSH
ncbi:hypothetical protein [Aeromicrobium alkaliterrae]|uniref:Uncharacterized protein n=1 Tax=Aeromicrobium alkaliterrae TaxID=302168 RepID=A0ABN2JSQ6_9ACTN